MYRKVDAKLDFVGNEEKILKFWKENNIVDKALSLNKDSGKNFVLHDGPPTANGKPHIGHVLTRAMKDVIPRYKSMKGYYIFRKAGWDTHGLPVEVEVEKELGFNGKKDIENYGIDKFIELCKSSVWKYKSMWEDLTNKIGYWVDMEHPYITYENSYIESVFWALKEMDKKGLIYQGHKVVPYCPRCGTSLSKAELENGDNYKIVKDKSIFVKFKSLQEDNTYFLVWTTTPWTLPSNIALCMNPEEEYTKISCNGENFIMLDKLIPTLFEEGTYKKIYTKKGKEFENQKYQPLFNYAKDVKKGFIVTVDDYVTTDDGTGIVHIAPAFGEDDAKVGQKYGLTFVQFVDDAGKMTKETEYEGVPVKEANAPIIEQLKREGKLFKVQPIEHSYPHCWRCKSPLLYYAQDAWFVKTTAIRNELVKNNQKINWIPDHIKNGRMGNFLANNIDWNISRNRYWGTPLPFWKCENGHIHVVGSVKELKELSGTCGDFDLHKPTLDKITFPCPKCGKTMKRTPEVMDCWFDSGSMPFAQYHYPFENKDIFEKAFCADYISEAIDQTRGWFNTLLSVNTAVFGKAPFKACNVLGLVLDKNGLKMSKSLKNGVDPWDVLSKYGADGVRWYFFSSCNPAQGLPFIEENLVDLQRKFMGTLWNVYCFYVLYAEIDKIDPTKYSLSDCKLSFLDKWLLSDFNALIKIVDENLDKYDMQTPAKAISEFVDKLSNWYIRRSRERFWGSEESEDKKAAYKTLYEVLVNLSKLIAPFVPFIAEEIYQNLVRSLDKNAPESVHFCAFPVADEKMIDNSLNEGMDKVLEIVLLGRACRSASNVKNRQPLSKVLVCTKDTLSLNEELINLIKDELNVENLEILHNADEFVSYEIKPQLRTVGPKYGKLLGGIKNYLSSANANELVNNVSNNKEISFVVNGENVVLTESDLLISLKNKEGFSSETNGEITVILDTTLNADLIEKGMVKEFISKVQNFRKESNFEVVNHIKIEINGDENLTKTLLNHEDDLKKGTLCDEVNIGTNGTHSFEFEFNGEKVTVSISKI